MSTIEEPTQQTPSSSLSSSHEIINNDKNNIGKILK